MFKLSRICSTALGIFAVAALSVAVAQAPRDLAMQRNDLLSHSTGPWGIDFGDQDRTVRPGDNFYEYQNGTWLKAVQFGPNEKAQAYWRDLRLLASRRVGALLEGFAGDASASPASTAGKAGAFYRSFMDQSEVEAKGLTPLKPELDALRNVTTKAQLAQLMGEIAGPGTLRAPSVYAPIGWSFFRLDDINQDRAHPERYAIYVAAGGMALPGPEYYSEDQFAHLRTAYVAYIAKVLALLGWPKPEIRAQQILELETKIAAVSWSHEQLLDPVKTYNPMSVQVLAKFAPGFDWHAFLKGAELTQAQDVVINAKSAFPRIAAIYAKAPLDVLTARQAFGLADQRLDFLSPVLLPPAIEFRGNALGDGVFSGAAPRPLRAEKAIEAAMGDILSEAYVAKYSSSEVKETALAMAAEMRRTLDARLATISWMSPAGRAAARTKLAKMRILIGFPDHFDDFAGLVIDDRDLYGNYRRTSAYQWRVLTNLLDKPFDGSRWSVRAEYPTFNYSLASNTVEIPAALLVPPFFDIKADPAVNYGAAGTIIGAMIATPFFTKQGLSYDADSRLKPLLGTESMARFALMRTRIAAQYSRVEQLPGFPLKGELVADEALGDLAGLEIALAAYHNSLKATTGPATLDGYDGDQRFFLGRAQMWRAKFVESFVRSQIATGSNEPPFMRVNGLLPNMDDWYAAFDVAPTDKLYIAPAQRVTIW